MERGLALNAQNDGGTSTSQLQASKSLTATFIYGVFKNSLITAKLTLWLNTLISAT